MIVERATRHSHIKLSAQSRELEWTWPSTCYGRGEGGGTIVVCGEVCGEVAGQVRVPALWVVVASAPESAGAGGGAGGASWETAAGGSAEAAPAGG